jgi:hypothetical protein
MRVIELSSRLPSQSVRLAPGMVAKFRRMVEVNKFRGAVEVDKLNNEQNHQMIYH